MQTNLDPIEREIMESLDSLPLEAVQRAWTTDRTWTSELKQRIGRLGKEHGYYICANGCAEPDTQGEWLYDLVWLSINGQLIVDVPLVLESEWATDRKNILEDFGKLLLARADHRVMIFQQKNPLEVGRVYDLLSEQISAFSRSQPGDRYLLAGFNWTPDKVFSHRLVIVP